MLIRFNIKNVYSFSSRQEGLSEEFSMIAGKTRGKKEHLYADNNIKLTKFAAIYGANAAGKSNLVKAMNLMREIIIAGSAKGHSDKYCKIDPENKDKASYFEAEILINGKYYSYGFEVILSVNKFVSEWLVELCPNNTENTLFSRDVVRGEYSLDGDLKAKGLVDNLNVYAGDVASDSSVLFLSIMNQNKKNLYKKYSEALILKDIYDWFYDRLDISYPNERLSSYEYLSDSQQTEDMSKLIAGFGTGITGFEIVDIEREKIFGRISSEFREKIIESIENNLIEIRKNELSKSMTIVMRTRSDFFIVIIDNEEKVKYKTIRFKHGDNGASFSLREESDGTVRLLDLLEILLAGAGKTYVIDELDRCLHPSLTYKFVECFLKIAAQKDIQLIVTTHESRLLDFDLLRRDEIWFVDKDKKGKSQIYSLEEYNIRFDLKIDKAYLEGRYGGIPLFTTLFPIKEASE